MISSVLISVILFQHKNFLHMFNYTPLVPNNQITRIPHQNAVKKHDMYEIFYFKFDSYENVQTFHFAHNFMHKEFNIYYILHNTFRTMHSPYLFNNSVLYHFPVEFINQSWIFMPILENDLLGLIKTVLLYISGLYTVLLFVTILYYTPSRLNSSTKIEFLCNYLKMT